MERFMLRLYQSPLLSSEAENELLAKIKPCVRKIMKVRGEKVYNIESIRLLTEEEVAKIEWALSNKVPGKLRRSTLASNSSIIEVGPRLNFETPDSTNAVSICHSIGIDSVVRFEQTRVYQFMITDLPVLDEKTIAIILPIIHDKMTECHYSEPPKTFIKDIEPPPSKIIPALEGGMDALRTANKEFGTGFDEEDLKYIHHLYVDLAKRNPTEDEWLDFGNSFSEHSRHHRFKARLVIDGEEKPFTLFDLVKGTLKNTENSIIAFHDNASAIKGTPVNLLIPERPGMPSPMRMREILYHHTLTCETHNHPCLWEADAGAATGGGGRRRDNQAVGRGGIVCAASTGYLGGNLNIDGYNLPWEDPNFTYSTLMETPLSFFIKATAGAYRDGNEFGEPVIHGFAESWGMRLASQVQGNIQEERLEYYKPVMFTGGFGFLDDKLKAKQAPEIGWIVVKAGGPAYDIGLGGGSASSMIGGENASDLDFKSVQRANGEMAKKTDRLLRFLNYLRVIKSMHDQGAGGIMNVVKEIIDPAGAIIKLREIPLGDTSLPTKAILVAEYQESIIFLIQPDDAELVQQIAAREKCPVAFIGTITGDGKAVVIDEKYGTKPIEFDLKQIFGDYPQKTFTDHRRKIVTKPLHIPEGMTLRQGCELVFRAMAISSKEWITHMVDRAVTGKVVQQQHVGPLGLPLSNYSIITPGYFDYTGQVNAVATRPGIGLISPEACAEITASEILLKLIGVPITSQTEIKLSANWMLPAKLPGGMAWLYDTALALKNILAFLDMDIDGGKDSLSLATNAPTPDGQELVRSLNTLVLTAYAACTDFRKRLTPDIKAPGSSKLMLIDFSGNTCRLGGSILAQTLKQIGERAPGLMPKTLVDTFDLFQKRILPEQLVLSCHKKTKGGLITTLCEMGFAGACGFEIAGRHEDATAIEYFFNEAPGLVIEYDAKREMEMTSLLSSIGSKFKILGRTTRNRRAKIVFNDTLVMDEDMRELMAIWRETSFELKKYHAVKRVVDKEKRTTYNRTLPTYKLAFDPDEIPAVSIDYPGKPRVGILREEGSNSDEEMAGAFYLAGFEPWDVTMTDLSSGRIRLDKFQTIAWVGGFSFKDVLGSAAGWAAVARYNAIIFEQLLEFYKDPRNLSLGVCNGCQLMNRLGLVYGGIAEKDQPRIITNKSECFESRFPAVRIYPSNSVFLRDMEGSVLPVHSDHGEGRYVAQSKNVFQQLLGQGRMPIRFVDDYGTETTDYPFNPNGSKNGVSAVIDESGRHMEWMLHPERTALKHQWHWWPGEWKNIKNSPWLRFFQNAFLEIKNNHQ